MTPQVNSYPPTGHAKARAYAQKKYYWAVAGP